MTQNANNSILIFSDFVKKKLICVFFCHFVFFACLCHNFDPIKVKARSAPQNDWLNLSSEKDKLWLAKKRSEMVVIRIFVSRKFW